MLLNQQQQSANTDTQNFALFMQRHGGGPSRSTLQSFHNYNCKGKAPLLHQFPPRTGQYRGSPHSGANAHTQQFPPSGNTNLQPQRQLRQSFQQPEFQLLDLWQD